MTIEEIMTKLPNGYVLGKSDNNSWYCKSSTDTWDGVHYYETPMLACANALIVLKKKENDI